ncbi:MAG: hypothetical protein K0U66_07445 [Gammaproteobacteria bacterium]|nr:hypothetical protein [Gammaproteobacteria bacterium]
MSDTKPKTIQTTHPMNQYFGYAHIPNPEVQEVSKIFAEALRKILELTPRGDMQDDCLRNLWAAKNCGVASLAVLKEQQANGLGDA